jgi:hypothetical protein
MAHTEGELMDSPLLVTQRSVGEPRAWAFKYNRQFSADYDSQHLEEEGLETDMLGSWPDDSMVVILVPCVEGSGPAGALGFDLGVDRWWLDWAYLEPAQRGTGLITRWWSTIRELLYEHGWPHIGYQASYIYSRGPTSPSGKRLIERLMALDRFFNSMGEPAD